MRSTKVLKELTGKAVPVSREELELLAREPMIRDALVRLTMEILVSGWVVKGSSDQIALFVRHILNRVWTELVMQLLDALRWGTVVLEVVWDIENVRVMGREYPGSVVPRRFLRVPLRDLRFLWDPESREIKGVRVKNEKGEDVDLLEEKVQWYSHMPTLSTWPRGVPITLAAKQFRDMFQDMLNLLAAYVENVAVPPVIGYCPPGNVVDPDTGLEVPAAEYLARKLQELRSSGILIVPLQYDTSGQPLWRVDYPSGAGGGVTEIARILEILRTLEAEAIYPPQAQAAAMAGAPAGLPGYVFRELLAHLNSQLVRYLVFLNWGEEEWAYVEAADQSADINLVRDIVRGAIQFSDEDRRRISKILDWYALLQMFGLPISMEEKKKEEEAAGLLPALGLLPGLGLGPWPGPTGMPAGPEALLPLAGLSGPGPAGEESPPPGPPPEEEKGG